MREILFRGKRKDNGEWVEGVFFPPANTIITFCNSGSKEAPNFDDYEVIQETVGQYTGFSDNNGKKIFEGDIVRYCDENGYYVEEDTVFIWKVVLECGAFGIGCDSELPLDFAYWCDNDNFVSLWEIYWNMNCCGGGKLPMLEVIGNVYDNPEMLEVKP